MVIRELASEALARRGVPRATGAVRAGAHLRMTRSYAVPGRAQGLQGRHIATLLCRHMKALRTDPDRAAHVAEVLKAVAHPLRLRIVATLCHGEESVGALAERLGATQPVVSQQLRILRSNGLVEATREDGFAMYRIAEPALRDLVCCMERCAR
jgi:ArsR family transcriptional regulator